MLFTLIMFTGIVILAPESLPITVIVVDNWDVVVPNKVFTVVPVKVNEVPRTDLLNLVPIVVLASVAGVADVIPAPLNAESNLISAIVAVYPLDSKVEVAPK